MPDRAQRSEGEPHNELTRIANLAVDALDGQGVRAIVMVTSEDGRGGMAISGYHDDNEAMVDLIMQIRAIFEANGKTFTIVPMERQPGHG